MSQSPENFDKRELYRCLQCAVCTGRCPVAQVVPQFNPREMLLRYAFDGEQETVPADELM